MTVDLRQAFAVLVLDVAAGAATLHHPDVERLTEALWSWPEQAPDAVCEALALAGGSTYARCGRCVRQRAAELVTLF